MKVSRLFVRILPQKKMRVSKRYVLKPKELLRLNALQRLRLRLNASPTQRLRLNSLQRLNAQRLMPSELLMQRLWLKPRHSVPWKTNKNLKMFGLF